MLYNVSQIFLFHVAVCTTAITRPNQLANCQNQRRYAVETQ
jgi:hypothetical protein